MMMKDRKIGNYIYAIKNNYFEIKKHKHIEYSCLDTYKNMIDEMNEKTNN